MSRFQYQGTIDRPELAIAVNDWLERRIHVEEKEVPESDNYTLYFDELLSITKQMAVFMIGKYGFGTFKVSTYWNPLKRQEMLRMELSVPIIKAETAPG